MVLRIFFSCHSPHRGAQRVHCPRRVEPASGSGSGPPLLLKAVQKWCPPRSAPGPSRPPAKLYCHFESNRAFICLRTPQRPTKQARGRGGAGRTSQPPGATTNPRSSSTRSSGASHSTSASACVCACVCVCVCVCARPQPLPTSVSSRMHHPHAHTRTPLGVPIEACYGKAWLLPKRGCYGKA